MIQWFELTLINGEKKLVKVGPLDYVRTEKHFNKSLTQGASLSEMFYMAYSAANRSGFAGSDFEAWLAEVENVEVAEDPKD